MGLIKSAADLTYTFRFIRMLVMDWKNWDAYKLGIIDENGKRQKSTKLDSDEKKSAYTPFIRLCANIKRLVSSIPGGGSKLGSFASALYLIKEKYELTDSNLDNIMSKVNLDVFDIMVEHTEWFILEDRRLSPGIYRIYNDKILNETYDDLVNAKDKIRIKDDAYPVGDVFGIDIYEATHMNTNKKIFIAASEIYK
tara:strand:- start:2074 stop:2661 length:588 start_codon:yes stop_codon:yes gene_type:complete